ncbi:MAG: transcriptional regulator [Candidatus Fonsibacter lacus]|nr:transcriptional regulator [Candidatus Fonsibacter lacus]
MLIAESLKRYGAARSIVIDEENRILAGNGTIEGAKAAGIKNVRIIDADGDELIAVRRAGLTEDEKIGLALADNRTSDLSEWDGAMLHQLSEEHDISAWFDKSELDNLFGTEETIDEDSPYTNKTTAPIYEPTGEQHKPKQLYDPTKTERLLADIETADIPDDVRAFLVSAAHRHTAFNYSKIADYYATAPKEIQSLFEDSALVIIDFEQAIQNGFVKLDASVEEAFKQDHPNA